jgi:hypothetical protein
MLRCSEWWVKEQARNRRIPYCWIGGSYRFTGEHLAEIVRLFEVRPTDQVSKSARAQPARTPAPGPGADTTMRLQARPPRRVRKADVPSTSAA